MNLHDRAAGRCESHDNLAWIYPDGSVTCMYDLIVEGALSDCVWGPMPDSWLEPLADNDTSAAREGGG